MGIKEGTRYKQADKRKRNQAIRDYKTANPDATLREIAEVFSLSHVRICKILAGNGNKS